MKKFSVLLLALLTYGLVAQNNVTFRVDLSGTPASASGVHIAGDFQSEAGFPSDWDPSATTMSNTVGSIYAVTVTIPDGVYQFKLLNGNAWSDVESVPLESQVGNGNDNRWTHIYSDTTLPAITFGGNAPSGMKLLSLTVDMATEPVIKDTISIAGNFQGWTPGKDRMVRLDSTTWKYRYQHYDSTNASLEWKYINGTTWGQDESVPMGCAQNGNRFYSGTGDLQRESCFAACGTCPTQSYSQVTFQIDMRGANGFDPAMGWVDIAGPFNGWPGTGQRLLELQDADMDTIYQISLRLPGSSVQYKVRYTQNGTLTWEPGSNKTANFSGDTVLPVRCFGRDTFGYCSPLNAPAVPDTFNVTLQVDMRSVAGFNYGSDSVDIAGPFNNWPNAPAVNHLLSDANGDSIFTITLQQPEDSLTYKARYIQNGVVNWEQSPNQVIVFNSDTVIPTRCFGTDTFGRCPAPSAPAAPDTFNVTLQVDMRSVAGFNYGSDSVDIAGPFNNWPSTPAVNHLLSDANGDSIFTITLQQPEDSLTYKARYIQNGVVNWEQSPNQVIVFNSDTVIPTRCFGTDTFGRCPAPAAPAAPDTFNVTLQVDMRSVAGFNYGSDSVDIAGPFNNWPSTPAVNHLLSDANGDSIFTITLQQPEDSLTYKTRYIQNGVVNWEQSPNQVIVFNSDTVIPTRCFGTDTFGRCPAPVNPTPDTVMVTVRIDMRTVPGFTYGTDSVDIAGPFNAWTNTVSLNHLLSDNNQDSIFEITLPVTGDTLRYKARFIRNGSILWEQSPNQVVAVPKDTILPIRCYGSASPGLCPVSQTRRITFQIDMSAEAAFTPGTDTVHLAGTMNGWNLRSRYRLFDPDSNLVYVGSFAVDTGQVLYKARYWSGGNLNWEGGPNRSLSVTRDSVLPTRCFGALSSGVCFPQASVPNYSIHQINGNDASGRADSIGTECRLHGTLISVDYRVPGYTMFLHDGTAGIQVYSDTNLRRYNTPFPGDSLKVMGTIDQYQGQLRLNLDSLQLITSGTSLPSAQQRAQFNESDESELVQLRNFRLVNPSQWPNAPGISRVLSITNGLDTLSMEVNKNTNLPGNAAPAGYFDLTGVVSQRDSTAPYWEHYLILPRSQADIVSIPTPKLYISEVMAQSSIGNPALDGVWFEIVNYGQSPITLQQFQWWAGTQLSQAVTIQNAPTLAAGERAVVLEINRNEESNWLAEWRQQGNNLPVLVAGRNFSSFPAVSGSQGRLTLWDAQDRQLSSVAYTQSQTQQGQSMLFDSTGTYMGLSQNQVNGAYTSQNGDVGSPGNLLPVSLPEGQDPTLVIYPNPTSERFQISWSGRGGATYRLMDPAGQAVSSGFMESDKIDLGVAHLAPGLYVLELRDGNALRRRKILVR